MNTYSKFCPNVFVAKCTEKQEKGTTILVTSKYGKENECIVFNLIYEKDGFFYYSIVRADGFDAQEYAKKKAEKLQNAALRADQKSTQFWEASNEGRDFLSLGEPIKIGHHSEKRHRSLIQRNHYRMSKSIEFSNQSEKYENRAKYWENRTEIINLSMPESIEYFEFLLEKAKKNHQGLKDGTIERSHSFSLTYANKEVKENEKKVELAKRLWS
jgi:hypothetical protein